MEGSLGFLGKKVRRRGNPETQPVLPLTLEESRSCLRLRKKISVGAACSELVEGEWVVLARKHLPWFQGGLRERVEIVIVHCCC